MATPFSSISFPEFIDGPFLVIGDIHGHLSRLQSLWTQLELQVPQWSERWVIFMGDYIDRGPQPRETIDWLLSHVVSRPKTICMCGNHDFAFSAFLGERPAPSGVDYAQIARDYPHQDVLWFGEGQDTLHLQGRRWPRIYEAESTFRSYGVPFGDREKLLAAVPESHKAFFRALPWVVEHPEYVLVHASLTPTPDLKTQLLHLHLRDLSNPRTMALHSRMRLDPPPDLDRIQINGHFYVAQVEFSPQRILVDTTGGGSGRLSAVLFPERKIIQSEEKMK